MERVLVTGGGGYIGTTVVPMLLEAGFAVRVLDRYFFGEDLLPEPSDQLELVKQDNRRIGIEHFANVDYVIDLAAVSNDPSGELFQQATWQINHLARVHTANLAKEAGVKRYVLPSSCSIYGFQEQGVICTEKSEINPLTTYAKANGSAERGVLPLADERFTAVVLRQSTVYGLSPRMRLDLAINGMTYGAWETGKLPLLRDGTQWRPMVHVRDTAAAQIFMLTAPADKVSGQIFNVGSEENNYQLGPLAEIIADTIPKDIEIEWYGEPDHRSYQVNFDKIESLGWKAKRNAKDATLEIYEALESEKLSKTSKTITLQWYQELVKWREVIRKVEMYDGIMEI
ncbi:MAG: NAD-dependent dehydratase [Planctomycetaceae bacterium]|nr:NAD-dependent dehydratase [Planctomycetaceae bacterium]